MSRSPHWVEDLHKRINGFVDVQLKKWADIIISLGVEPQRLQQYIEIYATNVEELVSDMAEEMETLQSKVVNDIKDLLEKSAALCKELKIEMPEYGEENLGLYKEKAILMEKVAELDEMKNSRLTRKEKFRTQIKDLCKCLGSNEPALELAQPIPTESQLNRLEEICENLETEKFKRTEKFLMLQSKIKSILQELNQLPANDFEKAVVSVKDPHKLLTETHLVKVDEFYEQVVRQKEEVAQKISDLRTRVESLWAYLDLDIVERDRLRGRFVGNSMDTLRELKEEVERCEQIRKANMQMFIEKLRTELVSLWDKCNFTDAQRSKFSDFYSTLYNEDLLDLHEIELSKVTRHYEECKELYEGFSKLKKQWNQLDELERKSADPDRFKNRGGQLLIEEKERNKLTRSIPKLEKDLIDLAEKYYEEKGVPFLYGGMDVTDYIKSETEKREESKKCQLTIRKQQKREALTPGKSGLGLFKSTSNLNLAMGSSCKRPRPETPSSNVKKRTKLTFVPDHQIPASAPPKVVTKATPLKKVAKKARRMSRKLQEDIENVIKSDKEYNMFQEYISKSNSRSTTCHEFVTPLKPSNHERTPQQSSKTQQSPKGSTVKLRAVNLEFKF